jgi:hypothetical protein
MMISFPGSLIPMLTPVVSFLRTLPLPSTHPSHSAAPVILYERELERQIFGRPGKETCGLSGNDRVFDDRQRILEWAEVNCGYFGVYDCQAFVCSNLIICVTGRVQALELSSLSSPRAQVLANPSTNGLAGKRPNRDENELREAIEESKTSLAQERVMVDLERAIRMS